ncbi:MAG: ATP-binding protein [Oscillospiraceae bacterium]|nr:ATP-binding protein [Oscillospiraceae bacterium]
MYDFYFRVYNRLVQDIKVPFKMDGGIRVDDTSVHKALREALANCLVHADYYGRQGLVIIKKRNTIIMSNPGGFRIELDVAKSGGVSDPRNGTMLKMFNLIDIGERAGSGIPDIFRVWREQGWVMPAITEQFEPERTILTLSFEKIGDKKSAINARMKESIIVYLTDHAEAKASSIAGYIGLKPSRTRDYLNELIAEGVVVASGSNRGRTYRLKA